MDNETCSNGTVVHKHSSVIILGSLSCGAFVTCLVAISCLLHLRLHRQLLYRLASYQVFGSLSHSLFCTLQLIFLNDDEPKYSACVAIAYLVQTSQFIKLFFSVWVTFHLFCFVILYKNMKKLEPLYVITSLVFPFVFSIIPLTTKSYGSTG